MGLSRTDEFLQDATRIRLPANAVLREKITHRMTSRLLKKSAVSSLVPQKAGFPGSLVQLTKSDGGKH